MDKADRAREMIEEEVAGLERILREKHGDVPARPDDRDYKKGRIDGLKQAGELLGE